LRKCVANKHNEAAKKKKNADAAKIAQQYAVYEETLRLKPHDAFAEKIISEYRASLAIPMKDKQAKCYTESKETK